jgi:hypothetical protein
MANLVPPRQKSCDTNPLSRTIKGTFLVISCTVGNIRLPLSSSCLMSHFTIFPQSPRPEAWGTICERCLSMMNYLWALPETRGTICERCLKHEELFVSASWSMRNYLWLLPEAWWTICERCLKHDELFVSAAWSIRNYLWALPEVWGTICEHKETDQ